MTTTAARPLHRRPVVWAVLAVGAVLAVVALLVFEPWKLFVDQTVDEAVPTAAPAGVSAPLVPVLPPVVSVPSVPSVPAPAAAAPVVPPVVSPPVASQQPAAPAVPSPQAAPAPAPTAPVELARGRFITHEHATSGSAVVLRLADGSRVLRLEGLRTSNGPALKVWITDAPVIEGTDGWGVFDDGRYVDLGDLKGNIGSSNYPLPASVDLADLSSVSIWCERFSVSFGAVALELTGG